MTIKTVLKRILLAGAIAVVAVLLWWWLAIRILDITFDASSVTLADIRTLTAGEGDAPAVTTGFLGHVAEIQSFPPGSDQADATFPWRSPDALAGPLFLSPPRKGQACDRIRLEPSREQGGQRYALSLFIEASNQRPGCTLTMRDAKNTYEARAGGRVDFLLKPPPAAMTKPTSLLENVKVKTLSAALRGAVSGAELGTCDRGYSLDISGHPLDISFVALGADTTQLTTRVRARFVTAIDVDGSTCIVALLVPKSVMPLVVFTFFFGLAWTLLSKGAK